MCRSPTRLPADATRGRCTAAAAGAGSLGCSPLRAALSQPPPSGRARGVRCVALLSLLAIFCRSPKRNSRILPLRRSTKAAVAAGHHRPDRLSQPSSASYLSPPSLVHQPHTTYHHALARRDCRKEEGCRRREARARGGLRQAAGARPDRHRQFSSHRRPRPSSGGGGGGGHRSCQPRGGPALPHCDTSNKAKLKRCPRIAESAHGSTNAAGNRASTHVSTGRSSREVEEIRQPSQA